MDMQDKDPEPFLAVGCAVMFQADPLSKESPRYSTVIRGWRKPSYVLLDRPKVSGRYAVIRANQQCVIRFVREGTAYAFDSTVLDWDTRQHNAYCRVEWPKEVQLAPFRKFERIKVQLPCKMFIGDTVQDGQIEDLSIGGCRVRLADPLLTEVSAEISFTLPDGYAIDRVQCAIRNIQMPGDKVCVGCEFLKGQACVESNIAFFVATTLERKGVRGVEAENILIIDENPVQAMELRRLLQERGYGVLIATETLDGLSRLRVAPPGALLVNQAQHDLAGLSTIRLVKTTRGLESLPVFLYNAEGAGLEEEAKQLGVLRCFRAGTGPLELVAAVVISLLLTARARPDDRSDSDT